MSPRWRALLHVLGLRRVPTPENGALIYGSIRPLERNEVSFEIHCGVCGTPHTVLIDMEPLR